MKSFILTLILGLFMLYSNNIYSLEAQNDQAEGKTKNKTIRLSGSPDLAEMPAALVSLYDAMNKPEINFITAPGAKELENGSVYFFASDDPASGSMNLSGKIMIGHEIIVPVINVRNPMLDLLTRRGMTGEDFYYLLTSGNPEWKHFSSETGNFPLKVFITGNQQVVSRLARYSGLEESSVTATKVSAYEELLAQIQKDIFAVGFCRLNHIVQAGKNEFAEQITVIPIDKNKNGQVDGFEQIYSSPEAIVRGVWIGKYPRQLSREIYAASVGSGYNEATVDFLEWVINDGQKSMTMLGYSNIMTRERTAGMLTLRPVSSSGVASTKSPAFFTWILVLGAGILILIAVVAFRIRNKNKEGIQSEDIAITQALNTRTIKAPAGLMYDKTHTWAFMEQNGLVKIGVDDFLHHVTGPLTQLKLKAPGEIVRKGEKVITIIQEGKQLDIYSPVTGTIRSRNQLLLKKPSQMSADPYDAGWIYQVEPLNWLRETRFMFMSDKFYEWLEDEFVRLKDFLAASANKNAVVYNHIVLQDGGELKAHVLAGLEPEVWEDFQTQFIDVSR